MSVLFGWFLLVLSGVMVECSELDPGVNATQVVRELLDTYKKKLNDIIQKLVKIIMPIVTEADLSIPCLSSLIQLISGIKNLEDWAVSMLDATAKLPVGVLDGTSLVLGDYDECLKVNKYRTVSGKQELMFQGQYCTVQIGAPEVFLHMPPEHRRELQAESIIPVLKESGSVFSHLLKLHYGFKFMSLRMGLCMPSTCIPEDVRALIETATADFQANVSIVNCEIKDDAPIKWSLAQILSVSAIIFCILVSAICTICDCYMGNCISEKYTAKFVPGFMKGVMESFSARRALDRLLSTSSDANGALPFIAAIRVASVTVIITGYSFAMPYISFLHNIARKVNHVEMREHFIHGLFGNVTVPTDTLIFVSGLLAAYQYGIRSPKSNGFIKSFTFLSLTVIRSLGGMILVIGLFILFPLIGDGPEWKELVDHNVQVCQNNWWRNMLFIQNFWYFFDNCMYQTYLQSVIVQCATFAVFFLWILFRVPRIGIALLTGFVVSSGVSSGLLNAIERHPPALAVPVLNGDTMFDSLSYDLIKPYYHLAPYLMGMVIGWALHQEFTWNKRRRILAWVCMLSSFATVFYVPFHFPFSGDTYRALSALYASLFRIIWSINLSAFVLLCARGGAGSLYGLASWKIWTPMDKLTHLSYLIHPLVLFYFHGQSRVHFFMGYSEIIIHAMGFIVVTYFLSSFIFIVISCPLARMSELFFKSRARVSASYVTTDDIPQLSGAKTIKVLA